MSVGAVRILGIGSLPGSGGLGSFCLPLGGGPGRRARLRGGRRLRGRRRGGRGRRGDRQRRGDRRLRVPERDLASRGKPGVLGGQRDAHRGDRGASVDRLARRALAAAFERDERAPVAERDPLVRRGRDRLTEDDEVGDGRAVRVGREARGAGAARRAVEGDLAVEEADAEDVGDGVRGGTGGRLRRDARGESARAHDRAVGRVGEGVGEPRRAAPGRRRHSRAGSRLAGNDDADRVRARRRGGRIRAPAGAGSADREAGGEDEQECESPVHELPRGSGEEPEGPASWASLTNERLIMRIALM